MQVAERVFVQVEHPPGAAFDDFAVAVVLDGVPLQNAAEPAGHDFLLHPPRSGPSVPYGAEYRCMDPRSGNIFKAGVPPP